MYYSKWQTQGYAKYTTFLFSSLFSLFCLYTFFFFQFSCSIVSTLFVLTFYVTIFCVLFITYYAINTLKDRKNVIKVVLQGVACKFKHT